MKESRGNNNINAGGDGSLGKTSSKGVDAVLGPIGLPVSSNESSSAGHSLFGLGWFGWSLLRVLKMLPTFL